MSRTGILLINLGTPDSPSTRDVRRYLTEFLNDPRVIDISPAGRFFLVNFIIVPFRASKSAKLYSHIWTPAGSPLLIHGMNVKRKLQDALGADYAVELGMRYQKPSIASALENLRKARVEKIIILPLYPQYASSSTGSSVEKALGIIRKWEVTPTVEIISKFYDDEGFLKACTETARKYDLKDYDHFLFSYHGLPERHIRKSDAHYGTGAHCTFGSCCDTITDKNQYCYRASCFATTRSLVKALNIPEGKYTTSFQSRLDDKWIKPYSDKVLEELAAKGVKRLLVFSPAFVADCLETLHEIGTEYDELFKKAGGEKVQLVESLNDSPAWITALKNMIIRE
jgi:ferrochelatase